MQLVFLYPLVYQLTGFYRFLRSLCYNFLNLLRGNRRNQLQGKRGKKYGALWPRGTPSPFNRSIVRGDRIHRCRRADNFRRDSGVQMYNPFWNRQPPLTSTSYNGEDKPPTWIHGPLSRHFSTNPIMKKGDWSPPQAKGDTQRRYKTSNVYLPPSRRSSRGDRKF